MSSLPPHPCLLKLEDLKKKVANNMQIKEDANVLNKYRLQFEITQPSNLVGGELGQHQLEALEWMVNLASQQANGILADDMGLGKTIQAIAYLAYLREENGIRGKHLIVCPKSVSLNWIREINKWFPDAKTEILPNTKDDREEFLKKVVKPRKFDVLVCTYEGVKGSVYPLSRIKWEALIIDEAHKIKNSEGQSFQALSYLQATFKLLLTGTPLSNNLGELWTLLNFIMPEIFSDPQLFSEIEEAVQTFEGSEEERLQFRIKVAKHFHGIIKPYFKRRAKKDLELGLPPKIERTLYVPLSPMQLQLYKNYLRHGSIYGPAAHPYRNQMIPRKICLHPYLFPGVWPEEEEEFGEHCIQNCGKLKVVDKLLKKLLDEGHKTLLFSQFTMFLDILEEYCEFRGIRYCRLDGTTQLEERDQLMNAFNNSDKYQLFMLSTRAGGLGINLVGADRVIIYDIDWNPQNDIQAMDRAYRIGQTKPVQVYKLITEFTIEERVSDFQKYKLIWDELVIQKGAFMSRKREDPFSNVSLQSLENIGKGDIFRLVLDQNEKTIEEILAQAEEKNKQKEADIRDQLKQNIEMNVTKFNPFEEDSDDETFPQTENDPAFLIRRNYDQDKRERAKFERNNILPPYKFYIQTQKIRDLQFQLHMELKRDEHERNQGLIEHVSHLLQKAQEAGRFHEWGENEFNVFVNCHYVYLKEDYESISSVIKTKTPKEVESYSKYFFQKAPNNQRLEKVLQEINLGQSSVKKRIKDGVEVDPNLLKQLQDSKKEDSNQEKEDKSDLYKSKRQIQKEIKLMEKMEKQQQKQRLKKIAEEEKKNQAQEEKEQKERKERQKREEEKQKREEKKKEEKQKKEEEKQKKKEELLIKREDQKKRREAWSALMAERKEKKEKLLQEKLQKRKQKQEDLAKKREEKQRELQEKSTKRLQIERQLIIKQIERDSASSKTKSSHNSKSTEKKSEWVQYFDLEKKQEGSSLEIVTVCDKK